MRAGRQLDEARAARLRHERDGVQPHGHQRAEPVAPRRGRVGPSHAAPHAHHAAPPAPRLLLESPLRAACARPPRTAGSPLPACARCAWQGAGKTETNKQLLNYLIWRAGSVGGGTSTLSQVRAAECPLPRPSYPPAPLGPPQHVHASFGASEGAIAVCAHHAPRRPLCFLCAIGRRSDAPSPPQAHLRSSSSPSLTPLA